MGIPLLTTGCYLLYDYLVYTIEVFLLQAWKEIRIDNLEDTKFAVRVHGKETSHSIFCLCSLPPIAGFSSFLDCR